MVRTPSKTPKVKKAKAPPRFPLVVMGFEIGSYTNYDIFGDNLEVQYDDFEPDPTYFCEVPPCAHFALNYETGQYQCWRRGDLDPFREGHLYAEMTFMLKFLAEGAP